MFKEQQPCGFCLKPVDPNSQDVGFIKFPDGSSKLCHLTHPGVEKEWELQHDERK